ncbi:carbohydrate ABC transporter permease [Microbacterium sp. A93]|uniref:carbohydrate ABC transporter permease n=1 Tax=unclassified Microbacterium TaxID=2609290 RepID=UPI003F422960
MTTETLILGPGKRGVRVSRRQHRAAPYLFILPGAILFILTFLLPLVYSIYLSLHALRVTGGGAFGRRTETFVGFDNYIATFQDVELLASLQRLGIYAVLVIPTTLGLALVAALLLDLPRQRFVRFARTALLLPYAVPGVIAALMWGFLYLPSTSPASFIARSLGHPGLDVLSLPQLFGSLANIAIWGALGFNMIIMYTALRAIPAEIYDAARIDGCNEWHIALRIKIPLMAPALVLSGLFSVIGTIQVYSEPMILRTITSSVSSTFFPLMAVYREAFHGDNVYGASATSVVIALSVLLLSAVILGAVQWRRNRAV